MKITIAADSSADLMTTEDRSLVSVPLKLVTSEKEYVDDENLDVRAMVDELAVYNGRSGSACPGTGDWIDAFGDAEEVFAVTITSGLSGSYNSARVAKEEYESEHPGRKVCVVDSLSAGPELKLIVYKLQEYIAKGMRFDEICEEIAEYQKTTHTVFALKSLRNLANNGRVNPAVAKIAGMLGIQVVGIASEVGQLEQKDKARGEKKAIVSVYNNMKALGYKGGEVIIDHCFNSEAAANLKATILKEYQNAKVKMEETRGLCSFYAELGGMIIGFEG